METKKAVELFGDKLRGLTIRTESMGNWPGGLAQIIKVYPDEGVDPEVPLWVKKIEPPKSIIGIINYENIEIV